MILGAFDIKYMPRTLVKGQILTDLVAEFAKGHAKNESKEHLTDEKSVGLVAVQEPLQWKVYVDGAVNQKGSGVGLVLISPEKTRHGKVIKARFFSHEQ